jgi:DNA-directed RNA polymerase specialized sigma24 family protein
MSYEEVAQVSGLTVPAVKTRLHRARLKIKLRLDPYIAGLGKQDK